MTRVVFWDVDTLRDFLRPDGRLYLPGGEAIVPRLGALTEFAHARRIPIVASADNHEPDDAEISDAPDGSTTFPPHAMCGSPGQAKISETALVDPLVIEPELEDPGALAHRILAHHGDLLLHKRALDLFSNANVPTVLRALEPERIVVYGVATEGSVKCAVEGLLRHWPRAELLVVSDAIHASHPDQAERLLESWRDRGVRLLSTADVLDGEALETAG